MENPMIDPDALDAVEAEMRRQRTKYGNAHHDDLAGIPVAYMSVLSEEVGEVARSVNRSALSRLCSEEERREHDDNIGVELIHVAAVAMSWIMARRRISERPGQGGTKCY